MEVGFFPVSLEETQASSCFDVAGFRTHQQLLSLRHILESMY